MTRKRILIVLVAGTLILAACGDDDAGPIFAPASPAETTTSIATPSTTMTPATTASSTTAAPITTVAPTTTAAASTTAPPTTLAPLPLPPLIFEPDGLGPAVGFGSDPQTTLDAVTARLGAPSFDSGWIPGGGGPYGVCPGTEYRRVEFAGGAFSVQFTDEGYFAADGTRQFYAYSWDGGAPGPTPGPPISVDVGTTVQQILDIYPLAEIMPDDVFFGPVFRVDGGGWAQLWGRLTGTTPSDTVIDIVGGVGCGE